MANDLRPFFELRKLTSQELGMIEFVLSSPAFDLAFKPYLQSIRDGMQTLMLDRSQKRKDEYPDDFLAGGVCAIEGLLKFFTAALAEMNFDEMHDAMAHMTSEVQFEQMRQQGQIKPIVGADQSATPKEYNAAEDF